MYLQVSGCVYSLWCVWRAFFVSIADKVLKPQAPTDWVRPTECSSRGVRVQIFIVAAAAATAAKPLRRVGVREGPPNESVRGSLMSRVLAANADGESSPRVPHPLAVTRVGPTVVRRRPTRHRSSKLVLSGPPLYFPRTTCRADRRIETGFGAWTHLLTTFCTCRRVLAWHVLHVRHVTGSPGQ